MKSDDGDGALDVHNYLHSVPMTVAEWLVWQSCANEIAKSHKNSRR